MKKTKFFFGILIMLGLLCSFSIQQRYWGFFGHKRINRLAVFTLVPDMMPLFKKNIEFLTDHAVDPDKRRYAIKAEAPRHFIDLDRWGEAPFEGLPRLYPNALIKYGDFVTDDERSELLIKNKDISYLNKKKYLKVSNASEVDTSKYLDWYVYKKLIDNQILYSQEDPEDILLTSDQINELLGKKIARTGKSYRWVDTFSVHGILPYYFPSLYLRLVDRFRKKDINGILRTASDLGHYVGDAHVPLHTTSNYNGQLSNQLGLHAFWESRIPELFADKQYDYFVGKAEYIKDVPSFIWQTALESHTLVDSVLAIEKRLSKSIPSDRQYCFDERMGITIRTQCEEYAQAYQQAMSGMVEKRMRQAILAVGSIWYSAWIDAGQPNLTKMSKSETPDKAMEDEDLEKAFRANPMIGRPEN